MRLNVFLLLFLSGTGLLLPTAVNAWGEQGHRIIGQVALSHLDKPARAVVEEILGSGTDSSVGEACNWPDVVRKTDEWEWSAPFHYVNIPRKAQHYDRQRDCRDGICVTEGIRKFANELTRAELDAGRRWQAFAWLCHLAGDLHQPLHAGYKDDLGGNLLEIEYRGEPYNLHQFWDRAVIHERLGDDEQWARPLTGPEWKSPLLTWNPDESRIWTDESHTLVARAAYPPGHVIQPKFADQTWLIIRQQWQKSSIRLAQILNATLGQGSVQLEIPGDPKTNAGVTPVGFGGKAKSGAGLVR
jgi:hypothetical protein